MIKYVQLEERIFNTKVVQKIYADETKIENAYKVIKKAVEIMKEFEKKLSYFYENSEVSKINNAAGIKFIKVSEDTFEIIKESIDYSKMTNGLLDITIAPLVEEWGINTYKPNIPKEALIKDTLALVNYNDIILNEEKLEVMLRHKNQKIDLGGIAKGYIADKIIEFYKSNEITSGFINIGGNIKTLGKRDDKLWNVGINQPIKHSTSGICSIEVENLSVVTSGGYERGFLYNNELYHHILNPLTGYPSKSDLKSITIVNNKSIKADALATPLFIMGKHKACDFMKNNQISGIMITNNEEIIVTKDLLRKFKLFKDYKVLSF